MKLSAIYAVTALIILLTCLSPVSSAAQDYVESVLVHRSPLVRGLIAYPPSNGSRGWALDFMLQLQYVYVYDAGGNVKSINLQVVCGNTGIYDYIFAIYGFGLEDVNFTFIKEVNKTIIY